jgi:hypothetical protein
MGIPSGNVSVPASNTLRDLAVRLGNSLKRVHECANAVAAGSNGEIRALRYAIAMLQRRVAEITASQFTFAQVLTEYAELMGVAANTISANLTKLRNTVGPEFVTFTQSNKAEILAEDFGEFGNTQVPISSATKSSAVTIANKIIALFD